MTNIKKLYLIAFMTTLCSSVAYSQEFVNFKLTDKFKKQIRNQNMPQLLVKQANQKQLSQLKSATVDPPREMSSIIEELNGMLNGNHETIGWAQTQKLIENHDLGGGVLNFSGFTWYKPMLNYYVMANRELAPHLYDERWIVQDKFTIFVEAATLLTNLRKEGLVEITDKQIGAFAGVTFKRVFHVYHFATTYMEGLTADYSKLFLAFNLYRPEKILELQEDQALKKVDTFSFNAGGLISGPLGNGFELGAGVFINTSFKHKTLVQRIGNNDSTIKNEILRLTIEKEKSQEIGSKLSLQYDFFKLLKLTLLSYDLSYEFKQTQNLALTFFQEDKEKIITRGPAQKEFKNLLAGKERTRFWKDRITSYEDRLQENMNSRLSFLLFGTMKKRATEQIKIVKNGVEKIFFKHYSESKTYIQSFLSRIFQVFIQKIFDFQTAVTNKAEVKKQITIEYEKVTTRSPASVKNSNEFSLRFKQYFYVASTQKWYQRRFRNSAKKYTRIITKLPQETIDRVKKDQLVAPIKINSTIEIQQKGIDYFHNLKYEALLQNILNLCKVRKRNYKNFTNMRLRKKFFRQRLRGADYCAKKLLRRYDKYITHYHTYNEFNLMLFKKFIGQYFSRVESLFSLVDLFGEENSFIHGDFSAKTPENMNFQSYFKSGQFNGLGVVDSYKNKNMVIPLDTKIR